MKAGVGEKESLVIFVGELATWSKLTFPNW